ncbi:hypothetical protein [Alteribacter aurantiacus]|uniref:hypothetical protein n=1 Tax=Alteribacter aurantiacus TaxID=254410 RepID=UPI00041A80CA|nr:hypothetical protein [Alteribacter aurantiacus]
MKRIFFVSFLFILLAGCTSQETGSNDSEKIEETDHRDQIALEEEYEQRLQEKDAEIGELKEIIEQLEQEIEENKHQEETEVEKKEEEADSDEARLQLNPDHDFYTQFWFSQVQTAMEEELGFEPGVTEWQSYEGEESERYREGESMYSSMGALALDWVREREMEVYMDTEEELAIRTYLDHDSGEGKVLILLWGLKDDAVAGSDYLLHLDQSEEVWHLVEVETRHYCRRSVTDDGTMCN